MNLYFSPMACSLATRIALYEVGAQAEFTQVDLKAKRVADGTDFFQITPMGQVPALRTDDDTLITENSAVLQYVADQFPAAKLAPPSGPARAQFLQWLGFLNTEIHKAIFGLLFDPKSTDELKALAREKIDRRFGILQNHLATRELVLDHFTVLDAYLLTLLNWTLVTNIDLAKWPALAAYRERLLKRPSVAKAVGEEWALRQQEQAKAAAA